jgi:hypothetical protein
MKLFDRIQSKLWRKLIARIDVSAARPREPLNECEENLRVVESFCAHSERAAIKEVLPK